MGIRDPPGKRYHELLAFLRVSSARTNEKMAILRRVCHLLSYRAQCSAIVFTEHREMRCLTLRYTSFWSRQKLKTRKVCTIAANVALLFAAGSALVAQSPKAVISGPTGQSPYDIVRGWHKPFAQAGFAFGGNSGVFAESPDRIIVAQRGETRLPDPVPREFAGFAGSIGINVLSATDRRVWRNCLYTLDNNGNVRERWTQWDSLFEGSPGPGPHRVRISPYDPQHRVWVINETFSTVYVFSNDGKKLLQTLGQASGCRLSPRRKDSSCGRFGQSPRHDLGPRYELSQRIWRPRDRAGPVQRRPRSRRWSRRTHLRARSLRGTSQCVSNNLGSGQGRVRHGFRGLLVAARYHRR